MSADRGDLQSLREQLEAMDRQLLRLLRDRMQRVEDVARAKIATASPFRDPPREELVMTRVRRIAQEEGLDPHQVERLFRVILDMSVERQQQHVRSLPDAPLRVAHQGVEGAYSHLAAQKRYGGRPGGALLQGFETFRAAAEAVQSGIADVALLPIENTTSGSINETYDVLADTGLSITGEVISAIEHRLLGLEGARIEELTRVLSHPQALRQCEAFLRGFPWIKPEAEFNTAGAAKKVRELGDRTIAAIASEAAAQRYGLSVLREIPVGPSGNFTRFVEVSRAPVPCPADACKTSILFVLADQPGALAAVLDRFAKFGVNLTKLESRPLPGAAFRYRFYADLSGHAASSEVSGALEAVRGLTVELRLLGTYAAARAPANTGP